MDSDRLRRVGRTLYPVTRATDQLDMNGQPVQIGDILAHILSPVLNRKSQGGLNGSPKRIRQGDHGWSKEKARYFPNYALQRESYYRSFSVFGTNAENSQINFLLVSVIQSRRRIGITSGILGLSGLIYMKILRYHCPSRISTPEIPRNFVRHRYSRQDKWKGMFR